MAELKKLLTEYYALTQKIIKLGDDTREFIRNPVSYNGQRDVDDIQRIIDRKLAIDDLNKRLVDTEKILDNLHSQISELFKLAEIPLGNPVEIEYQQMSILRFRFDNGGKLNFDGPISRI